MKGVPSGAHEPLPGAQLWRSGAPVQAPVAQCEDDRQGLDAGLGEAVAGPLASRGFVLGQDAGGEELLQPVAEDVRRDALDRPVQQHGESVVIAF